METQVALAIFILIFFILMIGLSAFVYFIDKKTVGELHIYSNGEGEPPTWNFTVKKDLDLNKVSDVKYATFKVIKESDDG